MVSLRLLTESFTLISSPHPTPEFYDAWYVVSTCVLLNALTRGSRPQDRVGHSGKPEYQLTGRNTHVRTNAELLFRLAGAGLSRSAVRTTRRLHRQKLLLNRSPRADRRLLSTMANEQPVSDLQYPRSSRMFWRRGKSIWNTPHATHHTHATACRQRLSV